MSNSNIEHVLLDLDGTLTDPGPGFISSITHALQSLALPVPPTTELVRLIGPPLDESLFALTGDEALVVKALGLYRERYSAAGLYENAMYDGIEESLNIIKATGARIFLATSKPVVFARRVLDHFELSPFFSGVYGSQLDGTHANNKLLLAHLLANESISRDNAIMVGDRHHDIDAARANGVRSLGVTWGYGSEAELRLAGASSIISSPEQLPDAALAG